ALDTTHNRSSVPATRYLPPATVADPPGWMRPLAAFRHHNYRLYFGGQLVSLVGTWMQNIAQGWLVFTLTDSAFALGAVIALQSLPVLFFSLIGGVLADRVAKYRLDRKSTRLNSSH